MLVRNILLSGVLFLFSSGLFAVQSDDYKINAEIIAGDNISNDFVISNDARLVAYFVENGQRDNVLDSLFVTKVDGSTEPIRLAPNLALRGGSFITNRVIFSPDGSKVGFIYDFLAPSFNEFAYYIAPTDGSDAVRIDDLDGNNIDLGIGFQFSEDGADFFYIAGTNDGTNGLFKITATAQLPRERLDQLDAELTNVAGDFEFTSDNTQIIYSANISSGAAGGGDTQLLVVGVDGGASVRLDEDGVVSTEIERFPEIEFFYVSGEDRILYRADNINSGTDLFAVSLDGRNRVKLNENASGTFVTTYRVGSNGERIVFSIGGGTNSSLFSVSLDGSNLSELSQSLSSDQEINNAFYASPTRNQAIIQPSRVNDSRQPLLLVDFNDASNTQAVSPNRRPIEQVTFSSTGTHIAYKEQISSNDLSFNSKFYIANLDSNEFIQLSTSDALIINLFESFSLFGNESVIFPAVNANDEKNLYIASLNGQEAMQLNRNLNSVNTSLASQEVTRFVLLPSQNRLLYVGNTDDQNQRELFGLELLAQDIEPAAESEMCFPVVGANESVSVICL